MRYSPELRRMLKTGALALVAPLVAPAFEALAKAETVLNRKPIACTFHGINGDPNSGIIGGLNTVLRLTGYEVFSPQMSGGMNPEKEVWDQEAETLLEQVNPDISFWYSLAGRTMLRVGTRGKSPMGVVVSISARRPDVDVSQFKPTDPRYDFYQGGVDTRKFITNTSDGRYCFHSGPDGSVKAEENAPQLARAIEANGTFFDVGRGHYDIPGHDIDDAKNIIEVSQRWGIIRS